MKDDVQATANCNYSSLGGDVHAGGGEAYARYRALWEERPRIFEPGAFPIHLDLEATSRCNLRCTFCDKLPVLGSDQFGDMDFDLYRRLVDQGLEQGLMSLKLSYRGEPLLHPRIVDMVSHATKNGILDIYFNTNGMRLTEDMSLALMDAGLNRISISMEGTEAEPFEAARRGAKFDVIKANVARLMELRERRNQAFPKVRIQTVDLPGLDLDEYTRYWAPYCDETAVIDYKEANEAPLGTEAPGWACPQLWQRMTVEWDGTVHPCNNDDTDKFRLGNAADVDLGELWRSERVEHARELHRQGCSHEIEACRVCPWRDTQVSKIADRNQDGTGGEKA